MKTKLLDGERIFRTILGVFCKDEVESKASCILTDRRLIFEDIDILTFKDENIRKTEMDWGDWVELGRSILFEEDGALKALGMHREKGAITIYRLDKLMNLRLSDTEIRVTALQEDKGKFEQALFKVEKVWDDLGKTSEQLTTEDQKKIQSLVETAKEKAKSQKKEPDINDKILFLAEKRVKQGFINPRLKLEHDISARMKSSKTREQVIEELYQEETRSA